VSYTFILSSYDVLQLSSLCDVRSTASRTLHLARNEARQTVTTAHCAGFAVNVAAVDISAYM